MDTSKIKYLVIISSLIAILFPLVNIYYILPSFKKVIISNAEIDAERAVNFFARTIVHDGQILENIADHRQQFEELKEPLNVAKLKFFSPDGTIVYSSDSDEIGTVNSRDYFHQLVAKGQKFTKVVEKDSGKTSEGMQLATAVVETYVPIMDGDQFIGAAEVYYDITARKERINQTVSQASLATFVIIILFLLLANSLVLRQTDRVVLSDDRLAIIYRSPYIAPIIIGVLIFIAEGLVMVLLSAWPDIPMLTEAILDSTLLVMILAPVFYWFVVMPLMKHIEERQRTEMELQKAKDAADKANQTKGLFLANMSHEIRTPMNGIIGMTEVALNGELKQEERSLLEIVHSEADHLNNLLNDILDLSKIEAGKLSVEEIPFDFRQLLEGLAEPFRYRAAQKEIDFTMALDPDIPAKLIGDPHRIRQILVNLSGNALKFTPEGGQVAIRVSRSSVETPAGKVILHFSVTDSGIGIAREQQQAIFEKFTQADGTTTRKYGGTGLGTSISKELVELMNGEIGVVSELGQGSEFWFMLQLGQVAAAQNAQGREGDAEAVEVTQRRARILVADDYPTNQKVAQAHLQSAGHQVDIVTDGAEAIKAAAQQNYDMIFMDVQMPNVDGYSATRAIRQGEAERPEAGSIPIIAMTAHAMQGDREKCLESGMDDYLTKPLRKPELLKVAQKWLEQREPVSKADEEAFIADHPAAAQAPLAVLPIDLDKAVAEFDGMQDFLYGLVNEFLRVAEVQLEKMYQAVELADTESLSLEAHTIKGGAGNIYALPVCRAAEQVEAVARANDLAGLEESVQELEEELLRMKAYLQSRLAS